MKSVCFLSLYKESDAVTGGQVYDRNLIRTINEIDGHNAFYGVLGFYFKRSKNPFSYIAHIAESRKFDNNDLFITNSSYCIRFFPLMLWMRYVKRKPVYVVHHHFIYHQFNGIKKTLFKIYEKGFLKLATKVVVPSPYILDLMKKIRREEDLLFWPIPFAKTANITPRPIEGSLTFMGTIEPRKGVMYLLTALTMLKDSYKIPFRLNIIGKIVDKEYYESLQNYIEEHDLDVKFHGFLSREEIDGILSTTDVFTFPSLLEGYGMVLVEAQTYSLPIVCFNNSAMPYTVKDNVNGFVVENKNPKAFAEKLHLLLTDRNLRDKMSKEALRSAQSHTSEDDYAQMVNTYFTSL